MNVTDNNGKTLSTLSFIILPGNELLLHKIPKKKSLKSDKKDINGMTLKNNTTELFLVIKDILAYLDIKSLNSEYEKKQEKDDNKNNEENKNKNTEKNKKYEIKSKLFNIIGNLSFYKCIFLFIINNFITFIMF
jgi:hypothetical protein